MSRGGDKQKLEEGTGKTGVQDEATSRKWRDGMEAPGSTRSRLGLQAKRQAVGVKDLPSSSFELSSLPK